MNFEKLRNKKTILMSCCAPCSVWLTEEMKNQGLDFAVLFYNPNIFPFQEYEKRKLENKRLCEKLSIPFFDLDWKHDNWKSDIHGLETLREQGLRCSKCFYHRIKVGLEFGKKNNFTAMITSFGISKYKSQNQVNKSAEQAIRETNETILYINDDFSEFESERYSREKKYNFYHQKYCGCEYSDTYKK